MAMSKPPSPETTFVRQHADKTPKDIVALAKAAGLPITEDKVGKVRDYDLRQAAKKSKAAKAKATAAPQKGALQKSSRPKARPVAAKRAVTTTTPAATISRGSAEEKALRGALAAFILQRGIGAATAIVEEMSERIRRSVMV